MTPGWRLAIAKMVSVKSQRLSIKRKYFKRDISGPKISAKWS